MSCIETYLLLAREQGLGGMLEVTEALSFYEPMTGLMPKMAQEDRARRNLDDCRMLRQVLEYVQSDITATERWDILRGEDVVQLENRIYLCEVSAKHCLAWR